MDIVIGGPVVPWAPQVSMSPTPRAVRVAGAVVAAVASMLLGVGLAAFAALGGAMSREPLGMAPVLGLGGGLAMAGASTILPAALGGAMLAPAAWRARGAGAWLWVIVGLSLLAVLIGALTIAGMFVLSSLFAPAPLQVLGPALAVALLVVLIGIPLVGPFVLPFTAAGAVIWAVGMWMVRRAALEPADAVR